MRKALTIGSIVIGICVIGFAYYYDTSIREQPSTEPPVPRVGDPGSEHTHIAMIVAINGTVIDFSTPEFQNQADETHFEDGDGTIVHKHATGVTLPYFFETLQMGLSQDCVTTMDSQSYCSDALNSLSIFINRAKANELIHTYELQRNDQILVNYGPDDETELRLKLNAVPKVDAKL